MIEIRRFIPQHRQDVAGVIAPIAQREFGVDITAAERPDLTYIPPTTADCRFFRPVLE
ncbi:hypothetical protein ACL2XP_05325 [Sodalis sp. RH21]|uniref:hypothetical protein n=1 Tax=unclassified Sodalis (in: enterobacteria) TaxID=2636512 RepID=UPI0039B4F3D6